MNLKICKLIGIISFFPIWSFRGNLEFLEIAFVLLLFFIVPTITHFFIIKKFFKDNFNSYPKYYYLSLIVLFGLDHNLGLLGLTPYVEDLKRVLEFENNLVTNLELILIMFIASFLIFILIVKLRNNGLKILTVFLITIVVINIFDFRKNISSFPKISLVENAKILKTNKKKLVIIFDEMSGINSLESDHISGTNFKKNIKKFFEKYNFSYYPNAKSVSAASDISIPTLLNFITSQKEILKYEHLRKSNKNPLVIKSKNYFIENQIIQNKFFDKTEYEQISVHQSIYLDFCKHKKVIKCHHFNPFERDINYIEGFNNNVLSKSFNAYVNSLSFFGKIFLRIARQFNLADSSLDPIGEKAAFPYMLQKISKDLNSNTADLVFAHYLVPHSPFFWTEKCEFDGKRESQGKLLQFHLKTTESRVIQHNIERNCLVLYLDNFLSELSKKDYWNDLEIFFISDHGARILKENENFKSSIFAIKSSVIKSGINNNKIISNNLFKKLNY